MSDFPNITRQRGVWAAGSYLAGDVVEFDGASWLCLIDTSDMPGSVIPTAFVGNSDVDLFKNAHFYPDFRAIRFTEATNQEGCAQAKTARPMQQFTWRAALNIPGADQFFFNLYDSTDASWVDGDTKFASNNGVAFRFDSFNHTLAVLTRTSHGAAATTAASISSYSPQSPLVLEIRAKLVSGNSYDLSWWEPTSTAAKLTASSVTVPSSVRPVIGAWCGGTGGIWGVGGPVVDAYKSTNWLRLGGIA